MPGLVAARPDPASPAVILFTSGTEGEPKGVALSHANILANVAQVRAHIDLYAGDVLFNPLPVFHCFGLTVGTILPLIAGVKVVCHPTPLQPKEIVRRIRRHGATILLSTDTFINQYARASDTGELDSLRMAVCGAERLRDETRAFLRKKSSVTLLEGYGVTEAAPVIAANQLEANHPGTVGRLMAGMQARLEPVEGIPGAGQLLVQRPQRHAGLYQARRARQDRSAARRLVRYRRRRRDRRGRLHRHSRPPQALRQDRRRDGVPGGGGEHRRALWPDNAHAAVAMPDGRKGEQIVLVTAAPEACRVDLVGWAQNHGVTELAVPRRIILVEAIPVLATGKTDYVSVQKIAEAEQSCAAPR